MKINKDDIILLRLIDNKNNDIINSMLDNIITRNLYINNKIGLIIDSSIIDNIYLSSLYDFIIEQNELKNFGNDYKYKILETKYTESLRYKYYDRLKEYLKSDITNSILFKEKEISFKLNNIKKDNIKNTQLIHNIKLLYEYENNKILNKKHNKYYHLYKTIHYNPYNVIPLLLTMKEYHQYYSNDKNINSDIIKYKLDDNYTIIICNDTIEEINNNYKIKEIYDIDYYDRLYKIIHNDFTIDEQKLTDNNMIKNKCKIIVLDQKLSNYEIKLLSDTFRNIYISNNYYDIINITNMIYNTNWDKNSKIEILNNIDLKFETIVRFLYMNVSLLDIDRMILKINIENNKIKDIICKILNIESYCDVILNYYLVDEKRKLPFIRGQFIENNKDNRKLLLNSNNFYYYKNIKIMI